MERPDVFTYLDYRRFLRDHLLYLRKIEKLSQRQITMSAKFGSTSYINMVMDGRRNISLESGRNLGVALKLKQSEQEFFEKLILFDNATDLDQKDQIFQQILQSTKFQRYRETAAAEYSYFSKWYIIAIYEGVGTPWGYSTTEQMADDLGITPTEAKRALEILETLKLISKKGARWIKHDRALTTPEETQSLNVRNFHKNMINKCLEKIDQPDDRVLYGLTFPLSREKLDELKKKVAKFMRDLGAQVSEEENPSDVFQMNFQIFSLLKLPTEK